MTTRKPRRRPSIHMIDVEADALAELAVSVEKRMPDVAALLTEEISRATIHEARDMPRDIVTMASRVDFFDEANGAVRSVELVYPQDADNVEALLNNAAVSSSMTGSPRPRQSDSLGIVP